MAFKIGQVVGQYRIDQVVARGRATTVYLATDVNLEKTVVVKVLNDDVGTDAIHRERFIREARTAASLDDHPNIVKILNWGESDGTLYIVTQYVAGPTLEEVLANQPGRTGMTPAEALILLGQLASSLDFAHNKGFVHRDVKPSNVMVVVEPAPPTAYLLDFGITKNMAAQSSATLYGMFFGTADYASPEQIGASADIDQRADVYSLACTAFEMLTGQAPFAGAPDDAARIVAHLTAPVPSAHDLRPRLPIAVDAVIATGMSKDREQRQRSCGAFVADLRAAFPASELEYVRPLAPGSALPPPVPAMPVAEPKRSRRGLVLAAIAVAALIVAGIVLLTRGGDDGDTATTTTTTASPETTQRATTTTTEPSTTTTETVATEPATTVVQTTAVETTVEVTAAPPPTNALGDVIGQPIADTNTPQRANAAALQSRAAPGDIAPADSPMYFYAEWLRLTTPAATGPVIATADGYQITADKPVTLSAAQSGNDGRIVDAVECSTTCVSISAAIPIDAACMPGPGCGAFQSTNATLTAFQRATVNLRTPAISLLFDVLSKKQVTAMADATGTVTFDPATNMFAVQFTGRPQPGTVSLIAVTYADGTKDSLSITF